jgi:hypothetical protein
MQEDEATEIVAELKEVDLNDLLTYVRDWNTTARNAHTAQVRRRRLHADASGRLCAWAAATGVCGAQVVLQLIFAVHSPATLRKCADIRSLVAALLS